jgi:hypothetical protein
MGVEPVIVASARKHGVADADMLHALRNHVRAYAEDEGFTMVIGPARDARMLEVGFIESADGDLVVVHAMSARQRFLRR